MYIKDKKARKAKKDGKTEKLTGYFRLLLGWQKYKQAKLYRAYLGQRSECVLSVRSPSFLNVQFHDFLFMYKNTLVLSKNTSQCSMVKGQNVQPTLQWLRKTFLQVRETDFTA